MQMFIDSRDLKGVECLRFLMMKISQFFYFFSQANKKLRLFKYEIRKTCFVGGLKNVKNNNQ